MIDSGQNAPLRVMNLRTSFHTRYGVARAVDGVSFHVRRGETLALVGESGCGKTVTALSLMRLVSEPGRIEKGQVMLNGRDLTGLAEPEMCAVRGAELAMVFQEPMTSLNPVLTCGYQIAEAVSLHHDVSRVEARDRAIDMLRLVHISAPEQRMREYPHQLSGGMRQRVMIAMALSCRPDVLIADEPTTALDVTIQAQILDLLRELQAEMDMAVLLITHDLGVVAETADRVAVMYAGRIVESATTEKLFANPQHPYTHGLLRSVPPMDGTRDRLETIPGSVPDMRSLAVGCRFAPRCGSADAECTSAQPELERAPGAGGDHTVSCWKAGMEGA